MKPKKSIRVLLAEDHVVVRQGLRKLLESEDDFAVVGEASTGSEAVALTKKLKPDVVVMDIAMPLLNGLEATQQIRKLVPSSGVLILSAHGDDAYVNRVMELGAGGYLIKQTSAHFLAEAIRAIMDGKTYFTPSVGTRYNKQHQLCLDRRGRLRKKDTALTPREAQVLQLIAEGRANKQIGAELGISSKTVEKHRDHLMRKLDIHDTAGLTRYAISAGIIESSVQVTIL
jgi:DNA-binding NarL/FixJ family response regulator